MTGTARKRQDILTMSQKVHQYWVYIVASTTGTLYVGMTNNLERCIQEHKAGEIEGFSKKYDCKRLVYRESYDSVHRAIWREKQLKGAGGGTGKYRSLKRRTRDGRIYRSVGARHCCFRRNQ